MAPGFQASFDGSDAAVTFRHFQTVQTEANQRAFNVLDDNQKRIINPNFDPKPAAASAPAGDETKGAKGPGAAVAKKRK